MVVAVVGFIVTLVLNAFVLDEYDAYGEVPIPGSSSLHLPAGEATVSFHTQTIGSPSGGGFPVPQLGLTIVPPEGVPDPQVTENFGTTTTVNNDAHIRVWVVQIPAEGTYDITTDGQVNGYINPQLAFGHDSPTARWLWAFAGLFVVGLLELDGVDHLGPVRQGAAVAEQADLTRRDVTRRRWRPVACDVSDPRRPVERSVHADARTGMRIEQLKKPCGAARFRRADRRGVRRPRSAGSSNAKSAC